MVQVPESSQSDYSILRINMQSGNNMFLLTNYKVDTGKYLDRSFGVRTERSDGRATIDRGREMLVTFGKLSVNFRTLSGKT